MAISERQKRILRGLVRYREGGVDHGQLAARLGVAWPAFAFEVRALRALSGKYDLARWWVEGPGAEDAETVRIVKTQWPKGGLPRHGQGGKVRRIGDEADR